MGRTQLSPQRLTETQKTNIGRIIIFCEGKTEKYYFDYFAEIIKKSKYTDVEAKLSKAEVYRRLSAHLHNRYSKGHKGKTR